MIPENLRASLPKNVAGWLCAQRQYFIVEGADGTRDPSEVHVRRATDHAPLDIAFGLYPHIPDDGVSSVALLKQLPAALKKHVEQFGIHNIVDNLSDWLELLDGDLFRRRTLAELEAAMGRGPGGTDGAPTGEAVAAEAKDPEAPSDSGQL